MFFVSRKARKDTLSLLRVRRFAENLGGTADIASSLSDGVFLCILARIMKFVSCRPYNGRAGGKIGGVPLVKR